MIRRSFLFLRNIGRKTERRLWQHGIVSWRAFIDAAELPGIGGGMKVRHDCILRKAGRALINNDSSFFRGIMKGEEWRLYWFFRDETVFLDLESFHDRREPTIITLFDGFLEKVMVRGLNMDYRELGKALSHYKLAVTFNGCSYDLKVLERLGIGLAVPHIDLRPLCRRVGLNGGLKRVERTLGIAREPLSSQIRAGEPLQLYRMWRASGDEHYLRLLIDYNSTDASSLRQVMDLVYAGCKDKLMHEASTAQENITARKI